MGIGKKYRERRVQLNRPVQCGGNSNITEKLYYPLNKPVACVLLGLAVRDGFSLLWDRRPSVYTPYPCGYSRRDRYGNSSNYSLSERYPLRRPYRRYLPLPCFRLASSVLIQHRLCLPSSHHAFFFSLFYYKSFGCFFFYHVPPIGEAGSITSRGQRLLNVIFIQWAFWGKGEFPLASASTTKGNQPVYSKEQFIQEKNSDIIQTSFKKNSLFKKKIQTLRIQ